MQHRPATRDFRADLAKYLHAALPDSPDEVVLRINGADYRLTLKPVQAMPAQPLFELPPSSTDAFRV